MPPEAGLAQAVRGQHGGRGAAGPGRRRGRATPAAGTGGRPRATSSGAGARPGCGPRPARRRGPTALASWYWSARARASSRRVGDGGRERDDGRPARREPDPPAQAEDRVEHRAGRPRERRARVERRGVGRRPAAAEEAGAVGLVLDARRRPAPSTATTWTAQTGCWSATAGRRRQSRASEPGSHSVSRNSLPKAGWARSARVAAEHDLGVAGQLQLARAGVVVGQRDPADLGELLGRDGDLQQRLDRRRRGGGTSALSAEKTDLVVRRPAGRPAGGRPTRRAPVAEVADVEELAPGVAGARPRASGSRPGRGRCCSPTRRW